MKIKSNTGTIINTQMRIDDDSSTIPHYIIKKGSYEQTIFLFDKFGQGFNIESNYGKGDGRIIIDDLIRICCKFSMGVSNDENVYTANKFIKFDGEAFEPTYFGNNEKY